ncbi:hypothetical protein Tco_0543382 [Tanacetum coccineum]
MSTPAHFDLEIISQTNRAQSSRVPTLLPDDPYVAVRQAHLVDTDTASGPLEDLRETEIPRPLLVVPSPVPSSDDLHLTVRQAYTPATVNTESEPEEAPSEIEEFLPLVSRAPLTNEEFEASEPSDTRTTLSHSSASSNSTVPLSPDHLLTRTSPTPTPTRALFHHRTARMTVRAQPAMSPGLSTRVTEAITLSYSVFCKRYRSSYETPSPSPSPALPSRKRYRGTSELIEDIEGESLEPDSEREGSEDKNSNSEAKEDATPKSQQQAVQVVDTVVDELLGLAYGAARRHAFKSAEETPPSPEWSSSSLLVSPSSLTVPNPVASPAGSSPIALPATVEAESFLNKLGSQVEFLGWLIHDHAQCLDALPPPLFEGYDRDLRELYTRSRAIRDEIFSQRYRLRSLKQEQEGAIMTFGAIWRPVLALESWVEHVDTQRVEMWQAMYDDHRMIHDLLVQNAMMQRELQELRDLVTTMERERSRRE